MMASQLLWDRLSHNEIDAVTAVCPRPHRIDFVGVITNPAWRERRHAWSRRNAACCSASTLSSSRLACNPARGRH
jgi:hypothetical protein